MATYMPISDQMTKLWYIQSEVVFSSRRANSRSVQQHTCISQRHVECLGDVQRLAKRTSCVRSQIIVACGDEGGSHGRAKPLLLCVVFCFLVWVAVTRVCSLCDDLSSCILCILVYICVCYTSTRSGFKNR